MVTAMMVVEEEGLEVFIIPVVLEVVSGGGGVVVSGGEGVPVDMCYCHGMSPQQCTPCWIQC